MAIVEDQRRRQHSDAPNAPRTSRPIPGDFSDAQVELGRVPQINASAMGAPGRAIAQAGAAFAEMGGHINARQKKDEGFAASKAYAELQNGITQDIVDHENGSLPDGSDHTLNWGPKWQSRVDEFNGKVSPEQRQRYEADVTRMGGKYNLKAGEYETGKRLKYQSNELTKYLTPQLKILKAHPTQEGLETVRGVSHNMINNMDLPPEQKEQLLFDLDENLSLTRLDGLADVDPKSAIAELKQNITALDNQPKQPASKAGNVVPKGAIGNALQSAAKRHGVDPNVLAVIGYHESKLNPNAKAKTSSARGLGQFIKETGKSYGLRGDGSDSVEAQANALARYTADNRRAIMKANGGREPTIGELYLSHFAGQGGGASIARAGDNTPISKVLKASAIAANKSILQGKTVGQVKRWAERSMNKAAKGLGAKEGFAPQGIDQTNERRKAQYGALLVKAEKKLAKMQETQEEQAFISGVLSGEIHIDGNDTAVMKTMNKAFNSMISADTNILKDQNAQAAIMQMAKNHVPMAKRVMQKMEGHLDSDDPAERLGAFQLLDKVEKYNSAQFSAGPGAEKIGKQLSHFRTFYEYFGAEGAVREMMMSEEHLSKMTADDLKTAKNKFIKDMDAVDTLEDAFDDHNDLNPFGSDPTLGVTDREKAQIVAEFKTLASHEFLKTGNEKLARASAVYMIKSRYGVSELSGSRAVMKYPPEKYISTDDVEFVQAQFQQDAKEAIAKWSPILEKQGIKVIGDPKPISDEHTRRGHEAWAKGIQKEEMIYLMDGMGQPKQGRSLPEWRIAVKVEVNGEVGYRLLDEYFSIEGLAQVAHDRLEASDFTNRAKEELKTEGSFAPGAWHNKIRHFFDYDDAEVVNKKEEMLNRE